MPCQIGEVFEWVSVHKMLSARYKCRVGDPRNRLHWFQRPVFIGGGKSDLRRFGKPADRYDWDVIVFLPVKNLCSVRIIAT